AILPDILNFYQNQVRNVGSAVVGRTFWDLAISALSTSEQIALGDILKSLGQQELIFPHPTSTFTGTHEYAFKHTILHDVTYESVLKRDRRRYHASIAQWLITKSGPRKDEVSGLIADHLEKAGQATQAIPYLRQAGEQARQTFANAEAVAYFTRALALLPSNDAQARCELLLSREQVYDLQGERSAQNQDLHALEQLAQDLPYAQQAQVCLRHANLAYVTGDYAASTAAAQRALQLAEQAQASQIKADAYLKLGQSCWRLAQYAEAQQNLAQALRLAQISGASQVEADALRNMGSLAYDQGNYPVAEEYFNRSLTLCQQISDRRSQSSVLNSLGILHRALGAISKSMDCYQHSLLLAREIGDRRMECATLINLGVLYRNQAEYAQAINQYEQALLILREIDDPQYESAALSNLAVIWNLQGALDKTIQYYQRVLTIKRRIGDLRGESVALTGLATVYINAGLLEQAREFITQALQLKRQTLDRRGELIALTNHSRLSRLQNATADAVQVAQQALTIAQELGDRSLIGYAYSELGTSLAAQGQHTEACTNLRKAITAWQEPGEQNLVFEAHAQIARSLLAQEQLLPALEEIEPTLSHIFAPQVPTDPIQWLMGATSSASVYMDCYIVLRAAQDNRAPLVLAAARQIIDAKAAMISDPALQRSFLETPTCRKIMTAEEDSDA
ncbi:MAG TPA: tetratricopeptide repeat protein, partial [Anaerolineales bacterium]|nr:tetratricopeptide repeat protein [Anaerolineales bacterium]